MQFIPKIATFNMPYGFGLMRGIVALGIAFAFTGYTINKNIWDPDA
jgi:hypothetical protein